MEICAYHESGHAVMALICGARVEQLSIAPDWDGSPRREGDAEIHWPPGIGPKDLAQWSIETALAGPVAEMIYTGDPFHPALVQEWASDWAVAWQAAAVAMPDEAARMQHLEKLTIQIHQLFSRDNIWQAIAALADELLAHEHLEHEMIHESVARWI